jgi:hypothetical protein
MARPYFILAIVTSLSAIAVGLANGDTTGFDTVSLPFWIGAGLNAIGAISRNTWVRGVVAVAHLALVILASYMLFSNEMI